MTGTFLLILAVAFPLSEIALAILKRAKPGAANVEDRGSLRILWCTISAAVFLAVVCQFFAIGRLPISPFVCQVGAIVCLLCGLAIRWASILTLGRLFTVDVAIQREHRLVESGPYKYVRHPSYTGMLLAFAGLGLYFANWLSLAALMIPISLAVANRIAKEESALHAALGSRYADYCCRTRRLIPGLF